MVRVCVVARIGVGLIAVASGDYKCCGHDGQPCSWSGGNSAQHKLMAPDWLNCDKNDPLETCGDNCSTYGAKDDMRVIPESWYKELQGTASATLRTDENGTCSFSVLEGTCGEMKLNQIKSIEFDVQVSEECQKHRSKDHTGDWIAVWLEPVCWKPDGTYEGATGNECWNSQREVDLIEKSRDGLKGYVATNWAMANANDGAYQKEWRDNNEVSKIKGKAFEAHITMLTAWSATSSNGDKIDVYVEHCDAGSSCKEKMGPEFTNDASNYLGNAHHDNMEGDISYRFVIDNWGNGILHQATPGCSISVMNLEIMMCDESPCPNVGWEKKEVKTNAAMKSTQGGCEKKDDGHEWCSASAVAKAWKASEAPEDCASAMAMAFGEGFNTKAGEPESIDLDNTDAFNMDQEAGDKQKTLGPWQVATDKLIGASLADRLSEAVSYLKRCCQGDCDGCTRGKADCENKVDGECTNPCVEAPLTTIFESKASPPLPWCGCPAGGTATIGFSGRCSNSRTDDYAQYLKAGERACSAAGEEDVDPSPTPAPEEPEDSRHWISANTGGVPRFWEETKTTETTTTMPEPTRAPEVPTTAPEEPTTMPTEEPTTVPTTETTTMPTIEPSTVPPPAPTPPFPGDEECRACETVCAPCKACVDSQDGECKKCWQCWDWDDDELENDDDDMDEDCDALDKDHDWDDEEVRCLAKGLHDFARRLAGSDGRRRTSPMSAVDCRACWTHSPVWV